MKEYLDKKISYMQELYNLNNLSDRGKIERDLLKEVKKQFDLFGVSNNEVELCDCGGNRRVALDCTMKPCKHPDYFK